MLTLPINRNAKYGLFIIGILLIMSFTEVRKRHRVCRKIDVKIENEEDGLFLEKRDIEQLINQERNYVGEKIENIPLKKLEFRIKNNKFVERVHVQKGIKGTLIAKIKQSRPIARIIDKDSSYYIGSKGEILPFITKHTARVVVITGEGVSSLFSKKVLTKQDSSFVQFLQYFEQDVFFKKQIASVNYLKSGEAIIYPQITKQAIEFGDLTQIEDKFKRLKIFYKKILPYKGWNTYESISVKFKGQIICK